MLLLDMAYWLLLEFRQASTRLNTPPFSKPSSPRFGHSSRTGKRYHYPIEMTHLDLHRWQTLFRTAKLAASVFLRI